VYIVVLVLLVTIASILSGSTWQVESITHKVGAAAAVFCLWGSEMYLVARIIVLGNHIREEVPSVRKLESVLFPHPRNQFILLIVASVIAGIDIGLALGKSWWCGAIILPILGVLIYFNRRGKGLGVFGVCSSVPESENGDVCKPSKAASHPERPSA
jgi:hypothetical protein